MWYFIKWLGRRIHTKLFKVDRFAWVENYRNIIMKEKPLAIILTMLLGAFWFIAVAGLTSAFFGRPPEWVLYVYLLTPPAFFVYHWLGALHEIYIKERERTTDYLKGGC